MYAAENKNDKYVELLIPKTDVKATNYKGNSALMLAAGWGTAKSVELLLPFSNVKATNKKGESALYIAVNEKDPNYKPEYNEIVRLLREYNN